MRLILRPILSALFALGAIAWSAPALATSGMVVMGGSDGNDASVARTPGRVFSAGGMIYNPRLMPAGRIEATAVGGAGFPAGTPSTITSTLPIGALAATGRVADNFEWALALSPDAQAGLGQRYMASDRWVWAGAYLARATFIGLTPDYGATYRQALMYTTGAVDLVIQPEASYYMTEGPQLALALGADWWVTPGVALGLNYQLGSNLNGAAGAPHRVGAGAKVLLSDQWYLLANAQYMMSQQVTFVTAGLGYFF